MVSFWGVVSSCENHRTRNSLVFSLGFSLFSQRTWTHCTGALNQRAYSLSFMKMNYCVLVVREVIIPDPGNWSFHAEQRLQKTELFPNSTVINPLGVAIFEQHLARTMMNPSPPAPPPPTPTLSTPPDTLLPWSGVTVCWSNYTSPVECEVTTLHLTCVNSLSWISSGKCFGDFFFSRTFVCVCVFVC